MHPWFTVYLSSACCSSTAASTKRSSTEDLEVKTNLLPSTSSSPCSQPSSHVGCGWTGGPHRPQEDSDPLSSQHPPVFPPHLSSFLPPPEQLDGGLVAASLPGAVHGGKAVKMAPVSSAEHSRSFRTNSARSRRLRAVRLRRQSGSAGATKDEHESAGNKGAFCCFLTPDPVQPASCSLTLMGFY